MKYLCREPQWDCVGLPPTMPPLSLITGHYYHLYADPRKSAWVCWLPGMNLISMRVCVCEEKCPVINEIIKISIPRYTHKSSLSVFVIALSHLEKCLFQFLNAAFQTETMALTVMRDTAAATMRRTQYSTVFRSTSKRERQQRERHIWRPVFSYEQEKFEEEKKIKAISRFVVFVICFESDVPVLLCAPHNGNCVFHPARIMQLFITF